MKLSPSKEPVAENDQHEPHYPWFLTGVTAPSDLQSTVYGISDLISAISAETVFFKS